MLYCTQRLARNDFGWLRPSPRRLGRAGEGVYVQSHGFGHEDWNFNTALVIDGYVYGYIYYSPADAKLGERFNIAFVTWDAGQWHIVGFWHDAEFCPDGAPLDLRVAQAKASDLQRLGEDLGSKFRRLNPKALVARVAKGRSWLRWRVKAQNVQALPDPLVLPPEIFSSANYRITTPKFLEAKAWNRILMFAQKPTLGSLRAGFDIESAYLEGRQYTAVHQRRERNASLVAEAKRRFREEHGRLFCEACGFDFGAIYGARAADFIEAHHIVPLSELSGSTNVRPEDLALICANCHRVIHMSDPWLSVEQVRDLIQESRSADDGG